jgi:hypothetical protein
LLSAGTEAYYAITIFGGKDSRAAELIRRAKDFPPHCAPRIDGQSRQHPVGNDAGVRFVPRGDVQSAEQCGVRLSCFAKFNSSHWILKYKGSYPSMTVSELPGKNPPKVIVQHPFAPSVRNP